VRGRVCRIRPFVWPKALRFGLIAVLRLNAAPEIYLGQAKGVLGMNHWVPVRILDSGSPIAVNNNE